MENNSSHQSNSFIPKVISILLVILPFAGTTIGFIWYFSSSPTYCSTKIPYRELEIWKERIKHQKKLQVHLDETGNVEMRTLEPYLNEFKKLANSKKDKFKKGASIPKEVIIFTKFDEAERVSWSQYPVIPIVYSKNLGIFETKDKFFAPSSGLCLAIES